MTCFLLPAMHRLHFSQVPQGAVPQLLPPPSPPPPKPQLFWWNLLLAFLHTLSLSLIACFTTNPWTVYLTMPRSLWVPLDGNSTASCSDVPCRIETGAVTIGSANIEWMVIAFHAPAVMSHLYACWTNTAYTKQLIALQATGHRWLEYSVSASIMTACIALLSNITDVWLITCACVMCAVTQLTGYLSEANVQSNASGVLTKRWTFFGAGVVLILPIWVNIYYNYHYALANQESDPPWWVGMVIYSLLVLFTCFAVVHALYLKDRMKPVEVPRPLVTAEYRYMFLSLTSKTMLAWSIWYGALGREAREVQAYHP